LGQSSIIKIERRKTEKQQQNSKTTTTTNNNKSNNDKNRNNNITPNLLIVELNKACGVHKRHHEHRVSLRDRRRAQGPNAFQA
jgi:hypothetical protein